MATSCFFGESTVHDMTGTFLCSDAHKLDYFYSIDKVLTDYSVKALKADFIHWKIEQWEYEWREFLTIINFLQSSSVNLAKTCSLNPVAQSCHVTILY